MVCNVEMVPRYRDARFDITPTAADEDTATALADAAAAANANAHTMPKCQQALHHTWDSWTVSYGFKANAVPRASEHSLFSEYIEMSRRGVPLKFILDSAHAKWTEEAIRSTRRIRWAGSGNHDDEEEGVPARVEELRALLEAKGANHTAEASTEESRHKAEDYAAWMIALLIRECRRRILEKFKVGHIPEELTST